MESARIRIIPVCEQDLGDMWVMEQYQRDSDALKEQVDRRKPALRVVPAED